MKGYAPNLTQPWEGVSGFENGLIHIWTYKVLQMKPYGVNLTHLWEGVPASMHNFLGLHRRQVQCCSHSSVATKRIRGGAKLTLDLPRGRTSYLGGNWPSTWGAVKLLNCFLSIWWQRRSYHHRSKM